MAYRWHPKLAEVDADNPACWSTCMRCGFVTNLNKMVWQWDFRGTPGIINTRILTCGRPTCVDIPNPQMAPIILSPDPEPVFNANPEPYTLDETSWLSTQDGDDITTQSGVKLITDVPQNPGDDANTAALVARLSSPGTVLTVAYLDLFNGDPSAGGTSVLSAITGSSVRTDIFADLDAINHGYTNPDVITVSEASESVTNVSYIGIYSASISGSLLMSGPVAVMGQTIGVDTVVQFNGLGLSIVTS